MEVGEARRQVAELLERLATDGPAAQRRWLRKHGVRIRQTRCGEDAQELTRLTEHVADQVLDAVVDEVATPEEFGLVLHPRPEPLKPPEVVGAADAHPGPPIRGWRYSSGETFYAYSRARRRIGWLYAEVVNDGTVALYGIYTVPEYRLCGVAGHLLLVARTHFGPWRSWVAGTRDPVESEHFGQLAAQHGIRVVSEVVPGSAADEDTGPGSRSSWWDYLS